MRTYEQKNIYKQLKEYRRKMMGAPTKGLLTSRYNECVGFIWALYWVDRINHDAWKRYGEYFYKLWSDRKEYYDYLGEWTMPRRKV